MDVLVTWEGTGQSYQDRSTHTCRYQSGFYKISTMGTTRDASITLDVTIDNDPFDVEDVFGGDFYKLCTLYKSTTSEISKYKLS
jgi:hypothetical protein